MRRHWAWTIIDQAPADASTSLVDGKVEMACLFGGDSISQARDVGSDLMGPKAMADTGIFSFDVITVTERLAGEDPDAIRTFLAVTDEVNRAFIRDGSKLEVIARESGMDMQTTRAEIKGRIFPTVEDQLVIYFNKAGLVTSLSDTVGNAFATEDQPARADYSDLIDTSFLLE